MDGEPEPNEIETVPAMYGVTVEKLDAESHAVLESYSGAETHAAHKGLPFVILHPDLRDGAITTSRVLWIKHQADGSFWVRTRNTIYRIVPGADRNVAEQPKEMSTPSGEVPEGTTNTMWNLWGLLNRK
jgi:hypothetical protein